jgi:hypothetical protein
MTSPPSHSPPFDFGLVEDSAVIALLRSGDHAQLLGAIFGEEYPRLCELARKIVKPLPKNAPRLYVLPGLMGSRLGTVEGARKHSLWLNLNAIAAGALSQLALNAKPPVQVFGAMLPSYLKFKLLMTLAGFDTRFFAYDWRKSILDSAKQFVKLLAADRSRNVALVGHSMGGLVARAALSLERRRIGAVIQVGAPNFGSFAPVQALRAAYPSMLKLAALDERHSADELARDVFSTLPGLYQLLPDRERSDELDLSQLANWPCDALRPDAASLQLAKKLRAKLSAARRNCHHIVGVDQHTVTGVTREQTNGRDELVYTYTSDGDGTVPRELAVWPDARTWYVAERHGWLLNNEHVCKAIVDLLKRGETRHLRKTYRSSSTTIQHRSDTELRAQLQGKVKLDRLPIEERRAILEPVISPQFAALAQNVASTT